ncbi:4-hydroxy-tetrahydrodipicolinate reductase 2, chloroplastic-like [Henckelia pumila]|uniref:4-hydroxy-tetrahydrodipicolinate reductase 2, chloroplastic-like n=1 Tax=Henckelia pumila TaxID=405737 RepID=UPI003C6E8D8E
MAFLAEAPLSITSAISELNKLPFSYSFRRLKSSVGTRSSHRRKLFVTMSGASVQSVALSHSSVPKNVGIPIMVNGCTGKMGRAVLEAAISAGLDPVPVALGGPDDHGKIVDAGGKQIEVHGPEDREKILASTFDDYPNLIVVDYTVPTAVNENAALYCKVGVPFVVGTTGGDRELLYKTVEDSKVYAVISPQMGKQVVAFLAAMKIMAEQFPGAFSGYKLEVMESHQASKLDISGTAKDVISCFQKLGVSYELDQVMQIRDPKLQTEMVGVPEEHLSGHAFHMYHLSSPDGTVSFEFQHNVCGRSIYAEGTVDAILFLAKKVKSNSEKRIFNMIDVLREAELL